MKTYTINDLKLKYKDSEKNVKKRHYKLLLNLLKSVNSGDYDIDRYYSLIGNKVAPNNSEEEIIVGTIKFINNYVETTKIVDSTLFLYQSLVNEKVDKEKKTLIKRIDALVMNIVNTDDIAELMLILSQIFKEANFPYNYFYIFTILNFYLMQNDISNIYISVEDARNLQAIEDESKTIKLIEYKKLLSYIFTNDNGLPLSYLENLKPISLVDIKAVINQAKKFIQAECQIKEVYLYGSFARKIERLESDIDLAVIFEEDMSFKEKEEIHKALKEYLFDKFKRFVDVLEIFESSEKHMTKILGTYIKLI
ncbi:MAG: Nucleotidyltransferase domain protein [Tenericutes bacterium ADurb.Bin087]|nr:MAG: Nucleotidyltransferase domain protein [Tenericutes bacterium ADurb.Bin087]